MITLTEAANQIQQFSNGSLTSRISNLENTLQGKSNQELQDAYLNLKIDPSLIDAAISLKQIAGQINVVIHAIGILISLPHILEDGEIVEALSLGAGNTGRPFDLETNRRVAEFKFINWKGGAESIRQNSIFKDFYLLAEFVTPKEKYLYVIDTYYPLKFFNSNRSLSSVLSRNNKLWSDFQNQFSDRFQRVNEYYQYRKSSVKIVDISAIVPQLKNAPPEPRGDVTL
jgi:hypothetical protein